MLERFVLNSLQNRCNLPTGNPGIVLSTAAFLSAVSEKSFWNGAIFPPLTGGSRLLWYCGNTWQEFSTELGIRKRGSLLSGYPGYIWIIPSMYRINQLCKPPIWKLFENQACSAHSIPRDMKLQPPLPYLMGNQSYDLEQHLFHYINSFEA